MPPCWLVYVVLVVWWAVGCAGPTLQMVSQTSLLCAKTITYIIKLFSHFFPSPLV